MALLLSFTPLSTLSPFPSSSFAVNAAPIPKLPLKSIDLQPKSSTAFQIVTPLTKNKRSTSIVRASETDGAAPVEAAEPPPETEKAVVPVDQLPLESKEKEKAEKKEKMKLARKLRLRRKRLVRKRKLRKKGRWPPSKMKKLKNI